MLRYNGSKYVNTPIKDEDTMSSDSAAHVPSQQSVKAYVDQHAHQNKPHIIPGVLYPAVGGKGIDGTTTVTSFGTDFAISG